MRQRKPATIIELKKKTLKDIVHMIPEQMIQDTVHGNIHKKCNASKQAEGNHFES